MLTSREIVAVVFLAIAVILCLTTIIGMYRMPDFYARSHAVGVGDTMGIFFTCVACAILAGWSMLTVKIVILFLIICLCNPVGTHILVRSAYKTGHKMTLSRKEGEDADITD